MQRIYSEWEPIACIWVAMLLALVAIVATARSAWSGPTSQSMIRLLIFWTLTPPFWFAFEYFVLFKIYATESPEVFDAFKYGQATAAKFWAGIVVLIAAELAFLRDKERKE